MKTAYCFWRKQNMEEAMAMGIDKGLTLITHFPDIWEYKQPYFFKNVQCPGCLKWCAQCIEEKGGITFRWYSKLWHELYIKFARPGAWKPGQPEGCLPGETFGLPGHQERIVSPMGELREPHMRTHHAAALYFDFEPIFAAALIEDEEANELPGA